MNILFLTRFDPNDIKTWSGTLYHVYHKLKEKYTIEVIGTDIILNHLRIFTKDNFSANTFIPVDRYTKNIGRLLSERINLLKYDLVFFGDLYFILSDIHIPFVLFSDMTFEQVKIHYAKPDERNIEPCINLEKSSLNSAYRIIYCSEWVRNRAIEVYDIDPNKIHVVEFGANIPTPQNYSIEIDMNICRLLFIGVDWERKGGNKILETYRLLKKEGFPCTLTIVGSILKEEPEEDEDDDDISIIPFLDKSKKNDLEKLCNILAESHFLVLPTTFDAFGIVFCEASAYAIPSITADVGGVGQAVKEGKNGFLLSPDATASDYAKKIKAVFSDKEKYYQLRRSSRNEFETRLNWDVWGERVNKILEDTVTEWKLQTKNN
jgi:glycosyltransferase involved in cell wall biosynthesis